MELASGKKRPKHGASRNVAKRAHRRVARGHASVTARSKRLTASFFYTDLFATGARWSLCRLQLHAVCCEVSVLNARV